MEPTSHLAPKLAHLISDLPLEEAENLKTILSLAAGGIKPLDCLSSDDQSSILLVTIARSLSLENPVRIQWQGHPDFLSDVILCDLESESNQICEKSYRNNFCWLHPPGPIAIEFSNSSYFRKFIASLAGNLALALLMYTYYKNAGDRLDLHLDIPSSKLTVLLMLRHTPGHDGSRSKLILVGPDAALSHCNLAEGEMLAFEGSRTLHGREPIAEGEQVALLTFLFKAVPDNDA